MVAGLSPTRVRHRKTSRRALPAELPGGTASESPAPPLLRFLLFPAFLLLALAFVTIRPLPDPDVWFHMALGREVIENGTLPRVDIFSWTASGREWISSGWASSVLLYLAHKTAGPAGLVWLTFAVAAAAHLLIYFTAVGRFRNSGTIVLIQMAGILAAYLRYTPRPDLWSHLFVAALLLLLMTVPAESRPSGRAPESPRLRLNRLWLLPPLFAVWANFHAGFMAGLLALGVYGTWSFMRWKETRSREDLLALLPCALCGLTWMLNPYGPRLLALAGKIESIPHVKEKIYEWKPLWAAGPVQLPGPSYLGVALLFGAALLVAGAVLVQRRPSSIPWWNPLLLVLFAGLAVYQRRHAGLAAVALPVLLIPYLSLPEFRAMVLRQGLGPRLVPAVAAGALVAFGLMQSAGKLGVGRGLFRTGLNATLLPVFATEWLRSNPPAGKIYNTYGAGAYLLYHLSPGNKVFIDGRLDVYDHRTWLDYLAVEDGSLPVRKAVERYDFGTFVLYTKDCASNPNHLVFRLADDPQWKLVFFDDTYCVYVRETEATRDFVAQHTVRYAHPFAPDRFRKVLASPATRTAALEELRRIQQLPGNGGAWTGALGALAAHRMGDGAGARQLLSVAMTRDPGNPLVRAVWEETAR